MLNGIAEWIRIYRLGLARQLDADRISDPQDQDALAHNLKMLLPYVRRHWRSGAFGIGLLITAPLLGFLNPLISRFLLDDVIIARRLDLLPAALLAFILFALVSRLLSLANPFGIARFQHYVLLDIQRDLLDRVLRFPIPFFDKTSSGYLTNRLSADVDGLSWFLSGPLVQLPISLLRLLGGIGFLFFLEPRLAVGVLLIIPLGLLWSRFFSSRIRALSHTRNEQGADFAARFQELIASIPLIKAFATEGRAVQDLVSRLQERFQLSLEVTAIGSATSFAVGAIPGLTNFLILALGALLVIRGEWTLGSLTAFQAYVGYVFGPAQYLVSSNFQLQDARASLERVAALFRMLPEENHQGGIEISGLDGSLDFEEVSFAYDAREPVLEAISFGVKPGEKVAIVGPSGVGKTTLLGLMLRFYLPSAGEVRFDGRPAGEYNLPALRRRIGYVSQHTQLLAGSLYENICYGAPQAEMSRVVQAAQTAGIDAFIRRLPEGYATQIGEGGLTLSEGQRQRLSIARALIKDPDILILDEPSSALDSLTEQSIFAALPRALRGKTLIVAAHRISTIRDSDRILVLDGARLAAVGTHEELLAKDAGYRRIVAAADVGGADRCASAG